MTTGLSTPTEALIPNLIHRLQAGAGRFMVTLCILDAPVPLHPPQSPLLKPFTFFMTRSSQRDGSKRLYLNMGHFDTLADAERWAEMARGHYPGAFATIAPGMPLRPADSAWGSSSQSVRAPAKDESLSDTQVLRILEARRAATSEAGERDVDQIALLGPDDTGTRRALKEAVAEGAAVCFAVQLQWSTEPIDLQRVRQLTIFNAYTLYATETRRHGHCRYFLRLGFFADPLSAKQVAVQVRSTFDAAAVVPVIEPEITRAREAGLSSAVIPNLGEQPGDHQDFDRPLDSSTAPNSPGDASDAVRKATAPVRPSMAARAERERRDESDLLSESGVRHLRVEALDSSSGRWKRIRLSDVPAEDRQFYS